MKRTGEVALGIIGLVFNALMTVVGVFGIFLGSNEEIQDEIKQSASQDPGTNPEDIQVFLDTLSGLGWFFTIATVIGFILALIAVINIKGNKQPKRAGILFIISAVVVGLFTIGAGWLPALLFLIAGIMSLVRKPQPQ